MIATLKPLGSSVLIRLIRPDEVQLNGIWIQDPADAWPDVQTGLVVRLGDKCRGPLQVGDKVLVRAADVKQVVKCGGETYHQYGEDDVLGKVED